jgi:hypothetical protein
MRSTRLFVAGALTASLLAPSAGLASAAAPEDAEKTWTVTDVGVKFAGLSSIETAGNVVVTAGFGIAPPFRFTPLVTVWDGSAWDRQRVRLSTDADEVQLTDVDLQSDSRGWVVGHGFGSGGAEAIAARWNGTRWRGVPVEGIDGDIGFQGVAATGRRNAWAVGQEQVGSTLRPVIAHYDGSVWRAAKIPPLEDVGPFTALSSVAASDDGRLWAVGIGGVALQYNGKKWRQLAVPKVGGEYVEFQKVRIFNGSDVWAVGYEIAADHSRRPVALRWTGSTWDVVQTPDADRAQLNDVAQTASGVVAVGYRDDVLSFYGLRLDPDGPAKPLILPPGQDALFGAAASEDGSQLWVVGSGSVGSEGKIAPYAAVRR